jgi:hypothetical protein
VDFRAGCALDRCSSEALIDDRIIVADDVIIDHGACLVDPMYFVVWNAVAIIVMTTEMSEADVGVTSP